jgi:hypothetical protein
MNNRSDNIVTLVHEMMHANGISAPEPSTSRIPMSFKTLCLATVLAAAGGSAVTAWHVESSRPINRHEKTEFNALVFYAARIKNLDEQTVLQDVRGKFHLANLDDMTRRDFLAVQTYLQDKAQ